MRLSDHHLLQLTEEELLELPEEVLRRLSVKLLSDEVRTLLRALYKTEADLLPDLKSQTLTIRLHHLAYVMSDNVIEKLCTELNATETRFPRTNLRMVFKLGVQSRINLKSWRSGCLKVGKNACPPYMAAYLLEIFLYPGRIGKGTRCILGYNQTKMTDKRLN